MVNGQVRYSLRFIHHCEDWRKAGGVKILYRGAKGLFILDHSWVHLEDRSRRSGLQGSPTSKRPISPTSLAVCICHWLQLWILEQASPSPRNLQDHVTAFDRLEDLISYVNPSNESSGVHRSYHETSLDSVDPDTWLKCSFVIAGDRIEHDTASLDPTRNRPFPNHNCCSPSTGTPWPMRSKRAGDARTTVFKRPVEQTRICLGGWCTDLHGTA